MRLLTILLVLLLALPCWGASRTVLYPPSGTLAGFARRKSVV